MSSSGSSIGVQDYRAVACLAPTGERLLCYGVTPTEVRDSYVSAWGEVVRDEDRPTVKAISLQKWTGLAWSGQWEHTTYLDVPPWKNSKSAASGSKETESENLDEDEVEAEDGVEAEVEDLFEDKDELASEEVL